MRGGDKGGADGFDQDAVAGAHQLVAFDGGEEPEGHPSEVAGEDDGDRGTNSAERHRERVRLRPYGAPLVW